MQLDSIVTLEDNEKYYLADETVQNGIKYFLANKLDETEEITTEAYIFEEIKDGEDFYLDEVTDVEKMKYLTAVFTSNLINDMEEMKEEA
ncbi:MAG: hypothetical protein GX265_03255 [Mollicutes bacterium]|jgi:hypothetical protein|nr:hypothetical protein [Mollicutes bacterium]